MKVGSQHGAPSCLCLWDPGWHGLLLLWFVTILKTREILSQGGSPKPRVSELLLLIFT